MKHMNKPKRKTAAQLLKELPDTPYTRKMDREIKRIEKKEKENKK